MYLLFYFSFSNSGVVCAAPESVKSLLLKFVEHLHSMEGLDFNQFLPGKSSRTNREITRLRDQMISKSDMADALVQVCVEKRKERKYLNFISKTKTDFGTLAFWSVDYG